MITRINQATPAVVYGLLAVLMAAVFIPMSLFRLVDGDEGTYLLVSRLVVQGDLPYHDFYYPQMFLLPYVYGAWMKLVGYSWYGARLLSALFSIALGLLVASQVARLTGRRAIGLLAGVLFTFSSLAFGWYPLVKTFVLPTLLLFAAYAVLSSGSRLKWVASGLLLGLSVACRLYVIAVIPAFLLEIYLTEREFRPRLMQVVRFALGLLIGLLPAELFFLIDPGTFVFNVVGSQVIRTSYEIVSWWDQKTLAPMQLVGFKHAEGATSIQFLLLFLVNLAAWVSSAVSRQRFSLASSIAILLMLASFVPTPVYTQYFSMPLPFLLVNAVVFCVALAREVSGLRFRHVLTTLATVYVVLLPPYDFHRYTVSGQQVPGVFVTADAVNWRLSTIRAVGRAIDRELRQDRPFVISFWPGYLVETRAAILPGMENHFALMFSSRVSPMEIVRFKLMSYPELGWHFQRHTVDVVVLGNWTEDRKRVRAHVVQNGYTLKEQIVGTEIYTLPLTSARTP